MGFLFFLQDPLSLERERVKEKKEKSLHSHDGGGWVLVFRFVQRRR